MGEENQLISLSIFVYRVAKRSTPFPTHPTPDSRKSSLVLLSDEQRDARGLQEKARVEVRGMHSERCFLGIVMFTSQFKPVITGIIFANYNSGKVETA